MLGPERHSSSDSHFSSPRPCEMEPQDGKIRNS
ncbi:hypothetical protein LEMLEM_LOCUS18927 [Lemmus lemmus]